MQNNWFSRRVRYLNVNALVELHSHCMVTACAWSLPACMVTACVHGHCLHGHCLHGHCMQAWSCTPCMVTACISYLLLRAFKVPTSIWCLKNFIYCYAMLCLQIYLYQRMSEGVVVQSICRWRKRRNKKHNHQ